MKIRVPVANDAESESAGRDWVASDFTRHLAAIADNDVKASLDRLVSAAKASTDPKIVAYVGEHLHYRAVSDLLAGRWGAKE